MTTAAVDILETIEFDEEGFMTDPKAWSEEIGLEIADVLGIALTDRHRIVINFAREYFFKNDDAPTLRTITKQTDVSMKEMYALFPGGPAKIAAKVSGLGKPTGCI
jgi:tRNA 2-thiouridine synthesizing protein E